MAVTPRTTILCISSYFKGNQFLIRCKQEGAHVVLLTVENKLSAPWAREHINEVFALPSFDDMGAAINSIAYLMRSRKIDRMVALDDYDVEMVANLREHFRVPGMGMSTVRYFRDKLAMRMQACASNIPIPKFVPLFNDDQIREFLETVPSPWLIKPRGEASSIGIHKVHNPDEVWRKVEELGDRRSYHLLERMLPGEMFHVDSLVAERRVQFAEVSRYHRPLLEIYQGGGIFATRILPRSLPEVATQSKSRVASDSNLSNPDSPEADFAPAPLFSNSP